MSSLLNAVQNAASDPAVVTLARLRNSEHEAREIAKRVARGTHQDVARAEVRALRGTLLGGMMREVGLKSAKETDPGVLEVLVEIAYRRLASSANAAYQLDALK